ncbi:hypothetical protein T440DRAFT_471453 [Plenodomus tracheiphilus IPT5]|uniref:Integral membrane protein n=1 Tax=Plenodomus tracheiphilus IPT5 TaxID=1408161 RepID=A0A6A7AUI6_9PLEO|nr:hypothetical protein T440DRAFT_471453 [Plenodomus tracheiphilus IPT5]
MLVFAQGFISTLFILIVGIKTAGLGMSTDSQCRGAIWICIVLYGASKIVLYLFLFERIHIVRAPFIDRLRDSIYIIGVIMTVSGYIAIMGYEFISPIAKLSRKTGLCKIGVQPRAAIAMIVFDTTIHIAMTVLFVWQLQPAMKTTPCLSLWYTRSRRTEETLARLHRYCIRRSRTPDTQRMRVRDDIRIMLVRNVIGSGLLLMLAATNNIVYLTWGPAQLSHTCLIMCMSDVALSMLITNWLTVRSPRDNDGSHRTSFLTPDPTYNGTMHLHRDNSQQRPSERETRGGNVASRREGKPVAVSSVEPKVSGGHT